MTAIAAVDADWVLDSRALPTVEVVVTLVDGRSTFAQAPSGASTGSHESLERRDGDPEHFRGKGVQGAVSSVRHQIADRLRGMDVSAQEEIDRALIELDGTEDRSVLGANAMVAVSAACARAGALSGGVPLWRHLARDRSAMLPLPMVNLFSGSLHASGGMGIQDVLVIPVGAPDLPSSLEWVDDVYHAAADLLRERGASTLVGDEGGFGAPSRSSEDAIDLATQAIVRAGFEPGAQVAIALDVAATHLLDREGCYDLDGEVLKTSQMIEAVASWVDRYPVVSVEDPLAEDDWAGWALAAHRLGPEVQLVGDDLLCTRLSRLERAAHLGAANTVLVKANQIGTLSEALAVADRARSLGMGAVVSARSGETEDDWLADLAVASGAGQIKVGSVARSERLAKYNRLLRIARSVDAPPWAGAEALAGDRVPSALPQSSQSRSPSRPDA